MLLVKQCVCASNKLSSYQHSRASESSPFEKLLRIFKLFKQHLKMLFTRRCSSILKCIILLWWLIFNATLQCANSQQRQFLNIFKVIVRRVQIGCRYRLSLTSFYQFIKWMLSLEASKITIVTCATDVH
jgi:hypothetical protein